MNPRTHESVQVEQLARGAASNPVVAPSQVANRSLWSRTRGAMRLMVLDGHGKGWSDPSFAAYAWDCIRMMLKAIGWWCLFLLVWGLLGKEYRIDVKLPAIMGSMAFFFGYLPNLRRSLQSLHHRWNKAVDVHWNGITPPAQQATPLVEKIQTDELADALNPDSFETFVSGSVAYRELMSMRGLEAVKEEIRKLLNSLRIQKLKSERGLSASRASMHMIFEGPPGTGKTTVARLLGQMLSELDFLSDGEVLEVDRTDLVAEHIGGTEAKTKQAVRESMGGILFIDEAYTLSASENSGDFGKIALDVIMKAMEDRRSNWVVIAAGYSSHMRRFLNGNPGMASRFSRVLKFDNLHPDDLLELFEDTLRTERFLCNGEVLDRVHDHLKAKLAQQGESFGNARAVRNLFEKIREKQEIRLTETDSKDIEIILPEDVPPAVEPNRQLDEERIARGVKEILAELEAVVGLETVKAEVASLADHALMDIERRRKGLPTQELSLNFIFAGPPGTGKTTIARIVGKLFYALGLLRSNAVIETDRQGLVAGYVGQTAGKTREVLERALDGVLFVDEAYTLMGAGPNDFGAEALAQILKFIEDHRGRISVIMAGYGNQMKSLLDSNPGLSSRFQDRIDFPSYGAEELGLIFEGMCRSRELQTAPGTLDTVRRILEREKTSDPANFGNARAVRNLFERSIRNQSGRLSAMKRRNQKLTEADLIRIEATDVAGNEALVSNEPILSLPAPETSSADPELLAAFQDCLAKSFWFKADLRSFLQTGIPRHALYDVPEWTSGAPKLEIIGRIMELARHDAQLRTSLDGLCHQLIAMRSYPGLDACEDKAARIAQAEYARWTLERRMSTGEETDDD